MFPIGDDNSDRTIVPAVNYAIIGLNVLVFVVLQQFGSNDHFTYAFSLVPKEIMTGVDLSGVQVVRDELGNTGRVDLYTSPLPVYFNFLSSMFMHGGFMHLFGNMLFLWVFGRLAARRNRASPRSSLQCRNVMTLSRNQPRPGAPS